MLMQLNAISSAVSKLVTLGDLYDLQRPKGHFPYGNHPDHRIFCADQDEHYTIQFSICDFTSCFAAGDLW